MLADLSGPHQLWANLSSWLADMMLVQAGGSAATGPRNLVGRQGQRFGLPRHCQKAAAAMQATMPIACVGRVGSCGGVVGRFVGQSMIDTVTENVTHWEQCCRLAPKVCQTCKAILTTKFL